MVRPRKIARNFTPVEWSDTDTDTDTELELDPVPQPQAEYVHAEQRHEDEDNESEQQNDLNDPLEQFAKEWMIIEMSHNVSKSASDEFWKAAHKYITANYSKTKCKNQSFTHLRRNLMQKYCPEISLDLSYKHKQTGEIYIEKDVREISHEKFRKPEFEPLHEIASIKVKKK